MKKIKYLAHPVSKEVVKEWADKGYMILDSKFNPNPEAEEKPKRTRKKKD
jgi:hypothetical protein